MVRALSMAMAVCIGVLAGGCGTVCNLAGGVLHPDREPTVYGGLQRDVEIMEKAIKSPEPMVPNCGKATVVLLAFVPAEFGLTFVGDTLTLPITIPLQERREAANNSGDEAR